MLLGLAAVPAHAADWRLTAARHTRYGHSLSFVDAQSIKGGYGQVRFSSFTFFSRKTRKMNRVAVLVTADCNSKMYRFQQIITFRNQRPLGEWHSTVPGTATPPSNLFDEISGACGSSDLGMHVESIETFAANYFATRPGRRTEASQSTMGSTAAGQ